MTATSRLTVPGWFISVAVIVSSIMSVGYSLGAKIEHGQTALGNRLCRIEYAVGLLPGKECDPSQFLIPADDSRVRPRAPTP